MRIRSILFIALIISVGFFFYSTHRYSEKIDGNSSSNSIRKSTLQLFPVPTLIYNGGKEQNTIVYDLLISKSPEAVFLYDTSVDMGMWTKYNPFDVKNLILELKYNFDRDRLDFSGSDLNGRKVRGYCTLTAKNNLKYSIKLIDPSYTATFETVHNPNIEDPDQPIFGNFTIESSVAEVFKELGISSIKFGNEKFHLKGSYKSEKNKISISNLILHGALLNMNIVVDNSKSTSYLPQVNIESHHKHINFDKLFSGFDLSRKDLITWNDVMSQISRFNIKLSSKADTLYYEGENLTDVALDLESDLINQISIKDFKFKYSKDSSFSTSGNISNKYFYPRYDGKFDIKNVPYKILAKIFNLSEQSSKNDVSASGSIIATPSVFSVHDLKLKEGNGEVESEHFRYVHLNNGDEILAGDVSINRDISYFKLISFFAQKYGERLARYGDSGTLGINLNTKNSKNKNSTFFRYSNIRDALHLSDVRYLNGAVQGDIKIKPQTGVFDSIFHGSNVEVTDLHTLLEESTYLQNASFLNNKVNSIDKFEFANLEGQNNITITNNNANILQNLRCYAKFEKGKLEFSDCKAKMFERDVIFSGYVSSNKDVLKYNISFNGSNVSLQKVLNKATFNKNLGSVEGVCDVQGYIESSGKTQDTLNKNISGSMAMICKDAKFQISENNEQKEISVVRGNFKIKQDKISSSDIYYKNTEEIGDIKLSYNFGSAVGEFDLLPKKYIE